MTLKKWHELPLKVRKNKKEMYKYLYEEITGEPHDGSSDEPSLSTATRNIHIDVDDGANAISGATVVIDDTSKTTGNAGGCNFNGLSDGKYTVTVSKEGFLTKNEIIQVNSENTNFTISLTVADGLEESQP